MSKSIQLSILLITILLPSALVQARTTDSPTLSTETAVEVLNLELSTTSTLCLT